MLQAAIALGAALLPTLIEEIGAALGEGLDEKAATAKALERMRAKAIPDAVSDAIAEKYRQARADEPTVQGPTVLGRVALRVPRIDFGDDDGA